MFCPFAGCFSRVSPSILWMMNVQIRILCVLVSYTYIDSKFWKRSMSVWWCWCGEHHLFGIVRQLEINIKAPSNVCTHSTQLERCNGQRCDGRHTIKNLTLYSKNSARDVNCIYFDAVRVKKDKNIRLILNPFHLFNVFYLCYVISLIFTTKALKKPISSCRSCNGGCRCFFLCRLRRCSLLYVIFCSSSFFYFLNK